MANRERSGTTTSEAGRGWERGREGGREGGRVLGDLAMDRDAFRHAVINALRSYDT